MRPLNYETLKNMAYGGYLLEEAPERVLQFGEGNFLRAFVDYFIDVANEKCDFNSKVLLAQPIANGLADMINSQQGLYTLYLRGVENGAVVNNKRVISSVSRCINPYTEYGEFLKAAHKPDLRFIVSNTTEAGIVFDLSCAFDDEPPASFPGKFTRFLYERFTAFDGKGGGLVVLPCELIDDNGIELEKCVKQYIEQWGLGGEFKEWVKNEVIFCPTLVDRIVTGYPRAEAEKLCEENGYDDKLLNTAEIFGLWVIEGPDSLREELPFEKAGLPVIITNDHSPYKQRKVRILNGAHTSMALAAYLAGHNLVRECMEDAAVSGFLRKAIFEEIIPTLTLPKSELEGFANAVLERFQNPYIDHNLLAISLNSVSKWKARVLPSVQGYIENMEAVPSCLTFGFAALIQFYCGSEIKDGKLIASRGGEAYEVSDDAHVLEFFAENSKLPAAELVSAVCKNTKFWGMDLSAMAGFEKAAAEMLEAIREKGMAKAMAELV